MAVKTYYVPSGVDGNFGALVDGVAQTAASRADGWTVAKIASGFSAEFDAGTKQASGSFTSDGTTPKPASLLTGTTANAFKTPAPLTGTFAAGSWVFTLAVRATTASSQSGRLQIRVYKSVNASGAGAVEITGFGGAGVAGTITGALSTTADANSPATWTPGNTIILNNEYLFFTVAWQITTASGSNSGDVVIRTGSSGPAGSRIVTTDFAAFSPKPITPAGIASTSTVGGAIQSFAAPVQSVLDVFNRAAGPIYAGPGNIWTNHVIGSAALSSLIVNNSRLYAGDTANTTALSAINLQSDFDFFADCVIAPSTGNPNFYFCLTAADTSAYYGWALGYDIGSAAWWGTYYLGGGGGYTMGSRADSLPAGGYTYWINKKGTTITLKKGPVGSNPNTFTTIGTWGLPAGQFGIGAFAVTLGDMNQSWDNMLGGPVVGPKPIVPNGFPTTPILDTAAGGIASPPPGWGFNLPNFQAWGNPTNIQNLGGAIGAHGANEDSCGALQTAFGPNLEAYGTIHWIGAAPGYIGVILSEVANGAGGGYFVGYSASTQQIVLCLENFTIIGSWAQHMNYGDGVGMRYDAATATFTVYYIPAGGNSVAIGSVVDTQWIPTSTWYVGAYSSIDPGQATLVNIGGGTAVIPTPTIRSTSVVSGSLLAARTKQIIPAVVSATSSVGGSVRALRKVVPASVAAASTVGGNINARRKVAPANVAATSTVGGSLVTKRAIKPANVAATSTVNVTPITARRAISGQIAATSAVIGSLTKFGGGPKPIISAQINAISTVGGAIRLGGYTGMWPLDENPAIQGTTINDNAGRGASGILTTNDGATNKSVAGKIGTAITFDGIDDCVDVPASLFTMGAGDFTAVAWVRNTNQATAGTIVSQDATSTFGPLVLVLNIDINNNNLPGRIIGIVFANDSVFYSTETATGVVSPNVWHRIVYRRQSGVISIWVDGSSLPLTPQSFGGATGAEVINNVGTFRIGGRHYAGANDFFTGDLDDVRLYMRALSDQEISGGSQKPVVPAQIGSTSSVGGSLTKSPVRPLTGNISATSTVGAGLSVRRRVIPAQISAFSTVSGLTRALRAIRPAQINALSTVGGNIVTRRAISGQISSTSTVGASLHMLRGIMPAGITSTSTVSARVMALHTIVSAQISSTSIVTGNVSTHPVKIIGGANIASTSVVSGLLHYGKRITPAPINSISTVGGSIGRARAIVSLPINSISTVSVHIVIKRAVSGHIDSISVVSGVVHKAAGVQGTQINSISIVTAYISPARGIRTAFIYSTSVVSAKIIIFGSLAYPGLLHDLLSAGWPSTQDITSTISEGGSVPSAGEVADIILGSANGRGSVLSAETGSGHVLST